MLRGAGGAGGARTDTKVGLLLLTLIGGSLVPVLVVTYQASRDPLPMSCTSGRTTSPNIDGALLYSTGSALWFADEGLSRPRKLVDYAPARPVVVRSPSPSAASHPSPPGAAALVSPGPRVSATPSSSNSPQPGISPSPSVSLRAGALPEFQAAAVSGDRRLIVFIVSDPPDEPGMLSLRELSPVDPALSNPTEVWNMPRPPVTGRSELAILPSGNVLFRVPATFDPPEPGVRLVGVIGVGPKPRLVESGSEQAFLSSLHTSWAETKDLKLPSDVPALFDRTEGPGGVVAGGSDRRIDTPLAHRTVHQLVVGRLGQGSGRVLCAGGDLRPVAFSPDGRSLALVEGEWTYLLDVSGGHAIVNLIHGTLLDWRP